MNEREELRREAKFSVLNADIAEMLIDVEREKCNAEALNRFKASDIHHTDNRR